MKFKVSILLLYIFIFFLYFSSKINSITLVSDWQQELNLPVSMASHSLAVLNKTIYTLGGSALQGGSLENLFYSTTDNEGKVLSWANNLLLPDRLIWHSVVNDSNKIFLLGGFLDNINGQTKNVNTVYFGNLNDELPALTWSTLTPLPATLALGASVIKNNKIYFAGGNPTPTYDISDSTNQNIYMAEILADGAIGNWEIAGLLPDKLIGFGLFEFNNYLYIVGGKGSNGITSGFSRIKFKQDGHFEGDWETLPTLPQPIWRFGHTLAGNILVLAGGQTSDNSIVSAVNYFVLSDSNSGSWQSGPALPYPNCCSPLVALNNYIYLIGGHDGGTYTNRVLKSKITLPSSPTPTTTPTITPTPTPSPTTTPTPSPTKTPVQVNKIFFIPGMGASWNLDAFINCKKDNLNKGWTIAPYAKSVYQNLLDKVPETGWQLLSFNYDWRSDVRINSDLFNNFVHENISGSENFNLLGHSMGGLVGRNYMEKQNGGSVNKMLMVGTPNYGSALAYPLFVKGEVWASNLTEKIAATLFIKHCGIFPSSQNLLPTDNYLIDAKTRLFKETRDLISKNSYLPSEFSYPFWGTKVGTLAGTGQKTLKNIVVANSPNWTDGKPVNRIYSQEGDGTVMANSVLIANAASNEIMPETHAGIIGTTDGINKILNFFGSPGIEDPPFVEPKSALVLIGFPGNFWIKDVKTSKTYQSEEGMIALINPESGIYELSYNSTSKNNNVVVAQFLENGTSLYKEYDFNGLPVTSKLINFNSQNINREILINKHSHNKKYKNWFNTLLKKFIRENF